MALTFDEALEEIEELSFTEDGGDSWVNNHSSVYALIQELQEVYAPIIEMTQAQYDMLIEGINLDHTSDNALAETLSADDYLDDGFNEDYWKPLNDRQVAQAWLHPETIKVVD